jgi:hypothetical protein
MPERSSTHFLSVDLCASLVSLCASRFADERSTPEHPMRTFSASDAGYISGALKEKCSAALAEATTFAGRAQAFCRVLANEFPSAILVRIYATADARILPASRRQFVQRIAATAGVADRLNDSTVVLNLMGSYGKRPDWCDPERSQGHLGIPLVSAEFVESVPMIARLLTQFGIGTQWIGAKEGTDFIIQSLGKVAKVFYVPDATSVRDHRGRLVIPAQDFVSRERVKTVFGVGGAYNNGTICALLLFTSESIDEAATGRFMPLINYVKTGTMEAVARQNYFEP